MNAVAAPGVPLYRRIESDVRDRIRSGELAPGAQVECRTDHGDFSGRWLKRHGQQG